MKPIKRGVLLIALALVLAFATLAIAEASQSPPPIEEPLLTTQQLQATLRASAMSEEFPPPEKNTCFHCHLAGENPSMWVPLIRWAVFGMAGLVFGYGFYRSGSVWMKRKRWTPLWQSVVGWVDERYQIVEPMRKLLSKPVHRFSTRWWYCLGGITFVLFLIQGFTGILLAFYYKPTPEQAYPSILFIENEVHFGAAIRSIHHWSANAMVIMVVAHMLRVFISGAFKPPRELNWITGMLLLIITLGFGFTGYLLPWDQRAFWATTVGSEIAGGIPWIGDLSLVFLRGGWEVGAITLSRFYAIHVLVLPIAIIVLLGLHFLMIRRQGIARPL